MCPLTCVVTKHCTTSTKEIWKAVRKRVPQKGQRLPCCTQLCRTCIWYYFEHKFQTAWYSYESLKDYHIPVQNCNSPVGGIPEPVHCKTWKEGAYNKTKRRFISRSIFSRYFHWCMAMRLHSFHCRPTLFLYSFEGWVLSRVLFVQENPWDGTWER